MCDSLGGDAANPWYLNPKNYSNRMYKLREPGKGPQQAATAGAIEAGGEAQHASPINTAIEAKANGDMETFNKIIGEMNKRAALRPGCQVVPLHEVMEVLDMGMPVAAMQCICRKTTRGCEECSLKEYTGLGLGTGMLKWERWPERYRGKVEFLSTKQAKEFVEFWDKKGFMHMLMQEGGDFIGGLCNCDYPDCLPIRQRIDYGLTAQLVKSEYVCFVDWDKCNGCGDCLGRCDFNALKYEATTEKAHIDQFQCFGCGLCETACPRNAIEYRDRKQIPGLAKVW
ncbi:MAG: 4Fe-4S binding protein [Dehalococcoidia bacterium]|nr:4Fe-4S binding protein [Dehalococcoidia bacterium]